VTEPEVKSCPEGRAVPSDHYSLSREFGFTPQAVALLVRKSFSFDLRQIKRDMR